MQFGLGKWNISNSDDFECMFDKYSSLPNIKVL